MRGSKEDIAALRLGNYERREHEAQVGKDLETSLSVSLTVRGTDLTGTSDCLCSDRTLESDFHWRGKLVKKCLRLSVSVSLSLSLSLSLSKKRTLERKLMTLTQLLPV